MARPRKFEAQTQEVARLVGKLSKPWCTASNKWLADQVGCCVRQIQYILKFLKSQEKLEYKSTCFYHQIKDRPNTLRWLRIKVSAPAIPLTFPKSSQNIAVKAIPTVSKVLTYQERLDAVTEEEIRARIGKIPALPPDMLNLLFNMTRQNIVDDAVLQERKSFKEEYQQVEAEYQERMRRERRYANIS
jgi:hypothetical protein